MKTTNLAGFAPALALTLMFAVSCGGRVANDLGDNGGADDNRVRRVTLTCNFEYEDGLDFGSGEVRRLPSAGSTGVEVDVRCTMWRLIALRASNATDDCYADALYDQPAPARFDAIGDVDGDCTLASVNCNYVTDQYQPVCAGLGGVMSDRAGVSDYAIRVMSDAVIDGIGTFVIEYAPID